jgi:hypothetical protein
MMRLDFFFPFDAIMKITMIATTIAAIQNESILRFLSSSQTTEYLLGAPIEQARASQHLAFDGLTRRIRLKPFSGCIRHVL